MCLQLFFHSEFVVRFHIDGLVCFRSVCVFDDTNFRLFGTLHKRITTETSSVFIRIFLVANMRSYTVCYILQNV